jgi:fatty acid desaturase
LILKNKKKLKITEGEQISDFTDDLVVKSKDISVKEALKSSAFWYLFFMFYTQQIYSFGIINNFKLIGLHMKYSDYYLSVKLGGINSILMGGFRPVAGYLYDKVGFKTIVNIINIL